MFKLSFLFLLPCKLFAADKQIPLTDYVGRLKGLEDFLIWSSFISCILIIGAFIYFSVRYKRKSKEEEGSSKTTHNLKLEIIWSVIPLILFLVFFAWGWVLYKDLYSIPKKSLEIHVYGQMWNWEFVYKNGRKTSNTLYVPSNRPVKLIMTSRDVIHSFFIPAFKIKQDVVPGTYTSLWFKANHEGKFHVFCTEFCGTGHSSMTAKLHVLPLEEWESWLKNDPYKGLSMVEIGQKTFKGRCIACHKTTSQKLIGPGLFALYKTKRNLKNGQSVTANENYIRESILNPGAKIVQGYNNQMTPFAGILTEEELSGLIEYIKSLK